MPESADAATVYEFTLNGTVCGEVLTTETIREAMELWANDRINLFGRTVQYGDDTVTVNGVTYGVQAKP